MEIANNSSGETQVLTAILLIEQNQEHAQLFKDLVAPLGFSCIHTMDLAYDGEASLDEPLLCFINVNNKKKQQVQEFINQYKNKHPQAVFIIIAEPQTEKYALEFLGKGAYDYLSQPLNPFKMHNLLIRCMEKISLEIENTALKKQFNELKLELELFSNMISLIYNASKKFISCKYLDELGKVIMHEFSAIFKVMGGSFFIIDNNRLQRIYSLDPGHTPNEIPLPLKNCTFFEQAIQKKEPLLIKNLKQEKQYVPSGFNGYKKESFLILPLVHNTHNLIGCVSLHDKENNSFTANDKKIGTVLAGLSASMIHTMKGIQELREREGKFRYFFDENPAADFIVTPQGRITLCNPSFVRILGYTMNDDGVEYDMPALYGNAGDWEKVVKIIKEQKKIESYETEFTKDDGTPVYVLGNFHGRFNEDGELLDIKGVLIDITQRKHLEEELNHSMKMEAVGRFAGSIAHDFNNLVTAILGYSELCLRRVEQESNLHTDINEIKNAAMMASELTKKLLYFSKKQKIKLVKINLNQIINEMDGMIRRLLGEEIELITFFDPAISNIRSDLSQIEQVIMNLVVNARDAMPEGGKLIIKTEQIEINPRKKGDDLELNKGSYVVLSIIDTGIGMDATTKSRCFEPFFSTKDKDKGTGLGLSTVYAIMQNNKGIIKVDSTLGKGTKFSLYFPVL
jgi:PAS domain S-box-containing protein